MDIFTELEDSLYRAITRSFETFGEDVEVMFSHSNAPEPTKDYIVINVLGMDSIGKPDRSGMAQFTNGQAKEEARQQYDSLVQLNFYGTGSGNKASLFHSQYKGNSVVHEHFRRNNLAKRTISDLRRSPQYRDSMWVNSFAMDIRVGFTVSTIQDVDWADTITVNGKSIPLTR